MKKTLLGIIAGAAVLLAGCGTTSSNIPIAPAQAQGGSTHTQVEFLARPGIGEAFLFTNSNLNTYNAVTPAFVNTAVTVPTSAEAAAAGPVLTEAQTVIGLLVDINAGGLDTAGVVRGFLPDVMRIDTSRNLTVADVAYASAQSPLNANGSPAGGRKLLDDVIDITLATLTEGTVTMDNVPYYRPTAGAGSTNLNIGHQNLNGQTVPNGPATFPFLAPAN